jgi:hypothetical protein
MYFDKTLMVVVVGGWGFLDPYIKYKKGQVPDYKLFGQDF